MVANKLKNTIYIYPTDTVWGIGCSIFAKESLLEINRIKRIDEKRPFSILFNSEEMLKGYFDLPSSITSLPLVDIFKEESTICFPIKYWKLNSEDLEDVCAGSNYVGVRLINSEEINQIINETRAPITSTSLNLTGNPPIVKYNEALEFTNNHPNTKLVGKEGADLSGVASSVVAIDDSGVCKIFREGRKLKSILSYVKL